MRNTENKTNNHGGNYHSRSVVKVECGHNMGTAVCVSTGTTGDLFLTCAHVVQYKIQLVILRYDGYVIRGKVIYVTHKDDPNDIAIIISGHNVANIIPCKISNNIPSAGQKVFAVGYACEENVPAIVFGNVQKSTLNTITTSCNVRTGFSGGPVFTSDGQMLGLTIGKLSLGIVHFVLPSTKFISTIKKHILTNDLKNINNLDFKSPLKKMFWNKGISHKNLICHI
ncbi:Peptidase S1, PA clan [Cinara cedri]|uniref:Peroxisomal leader peptide-processing protease n=1 Tax=Cinara cedri TaxID=506608 RepID=A0A5E4NGB3_9HEMI|nr:Peptidase S1, PA clan [Cinara cedri]